MLPPIPVFEPSTGIHTVRAITEALDAGWLGMGSYTKEFEDKIADFLMLGTRPVLVTNTGTSALHLGLLIAGVGPGGEVIVPSFNFVADMQAITAVGAEPVFCDIRSDNLGLDPDEVERLIGPRTRAIMPLHYAGIPCNLGDLYALGKAHGLRVIEDATHAFGSSYDGKPIGSFGDIVCFSFDPVKVITSIDGGAVVCNTQDELLELRQYRFLGIDKETTERYRNKRAWEYDVVSQGFRYHLTNLNASIGISQLERIHGFIDSRRATCREYNARLGGLEGIAVPMTDYADVSPFIYFVRIQASWRQAFIEWLRAAGIATGVHFMPAHRYSFYADCRKGSMTVTEQVSREQVTLPLHSHMPAAFVDRVVEAVQSFVRAQTGAPSALPLGHVAR